MHCILYSEQVFALVRLARRKSWNAKIFSEFCERFVLLRLGLSSLLVVLLIFAMPNIFHANHPEESAVASENHIPVIFSYQSFYWILLEIYLIQKLFLSLLTSALF